MGDLMCDARLWPNLRHPISARGRRRCDVNLDAMVPVGRWLEHSDWARRRPEFGELVTRTDGVAMEFAKFGKCDETVSWDLWIRWERLGAHPNILTVAESNLLWYAAIDWKHERVALDQDAAVTQRLATWGNVLVTTYEYIAKNVPQQQLALMACPIVLFDLEGSMRIAFVSAGKSEKWLKRLPPEIFDSWPYCSEASLVFVIGHALSELFIPSRRPAPVEQVIAQCLERTPSRRYATLAALSSEFRSVGARMILPAGLRKGRAAWDRAERGIGYLAVQDTNSAIICFEEALALDRKFSGALRCLEEARAREIRETGTAAVSGELNIARQLGPWPPPKPVAKPPWRETEPQGAARERERDFKGALALYELAEVGEHEATARHAALARCQFWVGNMQAALEHAKLVLDREPERTETRALAVEALLRLRLHADALRTVEPWVEMRPSDARGHHARGKCLLGLGRMPEARAEFDRACALEPKLVEAMLLRRDLDRASSGLRTAVGVQKSVQLEIAPHLAELRDVLVGGEPRKAIEVLEQPAYERDPAALLLLAGFLSFDGRHEEALRTSERVIEMDPAQRYAALLIKGDALLALDRAADALAVFDRIRAAEPSLVEALAGRARALMALGRGIESDEAFRQYVEISGRRSDVLARLGR